MKSRSAAASFSYECCEERIIGAAKKQFLESLRRESTFARSDDALAAKFNMARHGKEVAELVRRELVNSYALVGTLALCQTYEKNNVEVFDIELINDEKGEEDDKEAKLLHSIPFNAQIKAMGAHHSSERVFAQLRDNIAIIELAQGQVAGELLPKLYSNLQTVTIDGDSLAFSHTHSEAQIGVEVWDLMKPTAPVYSNTTPGHLCDSLFFRGGREIWAHIFQETPAPMTNCVMFDLRSRDPVCTLNTPQRNSLFVNDHFVCVDDEDITGDTKYNLNVFDRRNLSTPLLSHQLHTYCIMDIAMTLDNSTVVTCAWDGTLITMDINSGEFKKKNLWAKLGQLQILPNGIIAVADVMSVLSFLDMTTLDILRAYEVDAVGIGNNCTFTINETKLGAGMANGNVGSFCVFDLTAEV